MYATQDLRDEHESIRIALAIIDSLANDVEAGKGVEYNDAEDLLEFLKTFADRCHHGKEEDLLFPALETAGVPNDGGPIGVMLAEHTLGRGYIRAMGEALADMRQNELLSAAAYAAAAHGYVRLLRDHIEKENNILFTMAERLLSSEIHEQLADGFERIEQERIGPGVHEKYHAMLERFRIKYQ